jgi:hypothetical protein
VDEPSTADATCIARLWVERGDPVVRGRIESTLDRRSFTGRGVDELTALIRDELTRIENALAGPVDGG